MSAGAIVALLAMIVTVVAAVYAARQRRNAEDLADRARAIASDLYPGSEWILTGEPPAAPLPPAPATRRPARTSGLQASTITAMGRMWGDSLRAAMGPDDRPAEPLPEACEWCGTKQTLVAIPGTAPKVWVCWTCQTTYRGFLRMGGLPTEVRQAGDA